MFYPDKQPTSDFIWSNLTTYQKHTIIDKWYIYNYVESSLNSKESCYNKLSIKLGKCKEAIKKIYKNIKHESTKQKN